METTTLEFCTPKVRPILIHDVHVFDSDHGLKAESIDDIVTVQNSVFERNGSISATNVAHGVSVGPAAEFRLISTRVANAKLGHQIKTSAKRIRFEGCVVAALTGEDSRALDIAHGGDVVLTDTVLHRGPNSRNRQFIAYAPDAFYPDRVNRFVLTNVKFVSDINGAVAVTFFNVGFPSSVPGDFLQSVPVEVA